MWSPDATPQVTPPDAPRLPKDRRLRAPLRVRSDPTLRPKPEPNNPVRRRILPPVEVPPHDRA